MRILFVLENFFPHVGGVEVVFDALTSGLTEKGHEVHVVTHRMKNTKKRETRKGVHIHRIDCFHSRYLFTLAALPKVVKLAKRCDIIHTTTFNGAPPAWVAARFRGIPVVKTVHEVWIGRWKEMTELSGFSAKIHDFLERLIYLLRFDHYLTPSRSTEAMLRGVLGPETQITVAYNGVDYHHFDPKRYKSKGIDLRKGWDAEGKFLCLTYGRPGVSKGIEYAIMAFPRIVKEIPNARFLLMLSRDKAYEERYRYMLDLIEKNGIKDKTILLDPVPWADLPSYISASDVVIVPSLAEGFGYTAAESCAMEKPLVATDTTSIPEVVSGKTVLVPPRDPGAIARGVRRIFQGDVKPIPMRMFRWEDNIKLTEEIYISLVKSRKGK